MRTLPHFRYRLTRDMRIHGEAQMRLQHHAGPSPLQIITLAGVMPQAAQHEDQMDAQPSGATDKAKLN